MKLCQAERWATLLAACSTATLVVLASVAALMPRALVAGDSLASTDDLASLVIVTEDMAIDEPGCDAVSVFDLGRPSRPVFAGETHPSPGRLAALGDLSIALAINSNHSLVGLPESLRERRFVYPTWHVRGLDGKLTWSSGDPLSDIGTYFSLGGGIAVHADLNSMYVSQAEFGNGHTERGPYTVARYLLPGPASRELDEPVAVTDINGHPAEILVAGSGDVVHVVTAEAVIFTLDAQTLRQRAPPITMSRMVERGREVRSPPPHIVHAILAPDDRSVIVNRWGVGEINVADVISRTAETRPLARLDRSAGLAYNLGWHGRDRLAVHGIDSVAIYQWQLDAAPTLLGTHDVSPPYTRPVGLFSNTGPQASIAWDASGARLIAATNDGDAEFAVMDVAADGGIKSAFSLVACPDPTNYPNDIITANGFITPSATPLPPPGSTPTPTRTLVHPTPTETSQPSPGWTPIASMTASPSPTETTPPEPLYLPLLLKEHCAPEYYRSDIAVVIDTSSSMTGQKIEDARIAAVAFVRIIDLAPGRSQVAVVRFDREAEVVCDLTNARALIGAAIRNLQVRSGTHIDKGLRAALGELQSSRHLERNTQVLILLTDGVQTGTPGEELRAVQEVRAAGVRVFTIGLGVDVDEATLRTIAGADERYYFAPDSGDLARIYGEIAHDLMCPGVELWGGR